MSRTARLDAVVVGAGPNGLAAAVTLARAGRMVHVIEANAEVGGACRSDAGTLPGFVHDPCSTVHPLAYASPFLAGLPLQAHGLTWVHPDAPVAHAFPGGGGVVLERDLDAAVAALGPDGPGWRRLMAPLVAAWPDLAADLLGFRLPPHHPFTLARFGLRALQSAAGLARRYLPTDAGRALFAGIAGHGFMPLDRPASAALGLVLAAAAHGGGWPFPRGGASALTGALASLLTSLGGTVETGRPVRRWADLPPARAVLLDLTPRQVLAIAGDRLPSRYARSLRRWRQGPAAFKVDWALDGPIPWRDPAVARAATVHVAAGLDELVASERAAVEGRVAERPYLLVAQTSLFDPTRAPPGRHTAWAYCHVPHGWTGDATPLVEAQLERCAPGFRDRVLARRVRGPADLERENMNLVGGDIAGGALDLRQLLARPAARLPPWTTPVPGLFLCSSSTPPGPGVHGMCGHLAARQALRFLDR